MKISWRLYVDIYDTSSRTDLPQKDLGSGTITKPEDIRDLFKKIDTLLPAGEHYFKNHASTLRTKTLTLESPICYFSPDEKLVHSPALVLEPELGQPPTTNSLQQMMYEYAAELYK